MGLIQPFVDTIVYISFASVRVYVHCYEYLRCVYEHDNVHLYICMYICVCIRLCMCMDTVACIWACRGTRACVHSAGLMQPPAGM